MAVLLRQACVVVPAFGRTRSGAHGICTVGRDTQMRRFSYSSPCILDSYPGARHSHAAAELVTRTLMLVPADLRLVARGPRTRTRGAALRPCRFWLRWLAVFVDYCCEDLFRSLRGSAGNSSTSTSVRIRTRWLRRRASSSRRRNHSGIDGW